MSNSPHTPSLVAIGRRCPMPAQDRRLPLYAQMSDVLQRNLGSTLTGVTPPPAAMTKPRTPQSKCSSRQGRRLMTTLLTAASAVIALPGRCLRASSGSIPVVEFPCRFGHDRLGGDLQRWSQLERFFHDLRYWRTWVRPCDSRWHRSRSNCCLDWQSR